MHIYDLTIIGAGPAGIMAAITASSRGARVALVEKNPQLGRKLLSTGNGRCNICNTDISLQHFHGASPDFTGTVLKQFDQSAVVRFFEDLGLLLKEEDCGRMFPRTNQASSVVTVLQQEIERLGIDVMLGSAVRSIVREDSWKVVSAEDASILSRNLLVTTGGRASHQLGSTGDGLGWAYRLGHTITPTYPALVPLETVEEWPKAVQGLKIEAVSRFEDSQSNIHRGYGDIHFNNYGISGPAAMSLARFIAPELKNSTVQVHLNLLPDVGSERLKQVILRRSNLAISDILAGILPGNLIPVLLKLADINPDRHLDTNSADQIDALISVLKDTKLTISGLRPYKEAQTTSGGIDTNQIDPLSMKSRLMDNLYFAGEIVDVDGDSGGYNLQWAWSSGYVSGLLR